MKIREKLYPDGSDNRKPDKVASTSERLQEIMGIRMMKQADLARATGISRGSISNYVIGRYEPKSDIVQKLASALRCSEMWLWGYDVPMEKIERPLWDEDADEIESSPSEPQLTEGEKKILELFRKIPVDKQPAALDMLQAALEMQKKL